MGALSLVVAAALGASSSDPVTRWQPLIAEASARCGVAEATIAAVMRAESGGHTVLGGVPIRSAKGAIGLMQLMPATWAQMRAALGLGADPDDPRDNIVAGACYLRWLAVRFGYPGAFAAYNAGPGRYAEYLSARRPLPAETIAYLGSTGRVAGAAPSSVPQRPPDPLFAVRHAEAKTRSADSGDHAGDALFAVRSGAD